MTTKQVGLVKLNPKRGTDTKNQQAKPLVGDDDCGSSLQRSIHSGFVIIKHNMHFLISVLLVVAPLFAAGAQAASPSACEALFNPVTVFTSGEPWNKKIRFNEIEQLLRTATISSMKNLNETLQAEGKNASGQTKGLAIVTFENGIRAVWKPAERKLSEVGAYRAARLLGSRLIPPTVERTIDGQVGSLQYFVETPIDLKKLSGKDRLELWSRVSKTQRAARQIFKFVFGDWDLHWGNVLLDETGAIVQIDNESINSRQMVRYGKLPFVRRIGFSAEAKAASQGSARKADLKSNPFPFDAAILLEKPSLEDLTRVLQPFANPSELTRYIDHKDEKKTADLTMRIAFWDGAIWIQAIGFQNYGAIAPEAFPERVIDAYRALTFNDLRKNLPMMFQVQHIWEILERRDQILEAARKAKLK